MLMQTSRRDAKRTVTKVKPIITLGLMLFFAASKSSAFAQTTSIGDVNRRLDRLEQENAELRKAIANGQVAAPGVSDKYYGGYANSAPSLPSTGYVGFNNAYSYQMLDATEAGKTKPLTILEAKKNGTLSQGITLSGATTALADYQTTNMPGKVGYLMRHPENQLGTSASEIILHSAQFGFTANFSSWVTAYSEFLWDPSQSFGQGSITSLARNEVQLRKGYLLFGDTKVTPFYAMMGKIESAFGNSDTVSPFSLSTGWHTFSGLSYGGLVGYSKDGLNVTAEAVQGGSQFRGFNTPVDGGNLPAKVNNFVADANYRYTIDGPRRSVMVGASYEHGSPYCLEFPVAHFSSCKENNPAFAAYGEVKLDAFRFKGAFHQTLKVMPGTFNPSPPLNIYPASKITAFDAGVVYETAPVLFGKPVFLSTEFSKFIAGPSGAPWHRQSQWTTGVAYYPQPNVKLFAEHIKIEGYAPLNFLTGGNGTLDTNGDAQSRVVLAGVTVGY
jgi:hypothetical protein